MGDSQAILRRTVGVLESELGNLKVSRFYRTKPLYNTDQPDFLNLCVVGGFTGSPKDLLDLCHRLEYQEGRVRTHWKGQRTLDVDIVLFGDLVMNTPELTIPHPGLEERAFVLRPLLDLDPQLESPRSGQKMKDILDRLDSSSDQGVVPEA